MSGSLLGADGNNTFFGQSLGIFKLGQDGFGLQV